MRKTILLVAMLWALTAITAADIRIYDMQSDYTWKKTGEVHMGGESIAILCVAGGCNQTAPCSFCHGQPVDQAAFTGDRDMKHQRIYFPRFAVEIAEGQKLEFGNLSATRLRGVLTLIDSRGRTAPLPADALIIKARDGKPAFITYKGTAAPPTLK